MAKYDIKTLKSIIEEIKNDVKGKPSKAICNLCKKPLSECKQCPMMERLDEIEDLPSIMEEQRKRIPQRAEPPQGGWRNAQAPRGQQNEQPYRRYNDQGRGYNHQGYDQGYGHRGYDKGYDRRGNWASGQQATNPQRPEGQWRRGKDANIDRRFPLDDFQKRKDTVKLVNDPAEGLRRDLNIPLITLPPDPIIKAQTIAPAVIEPRKRCPLEILEPPANMKVPPFKRQDATLNISSPPPPGIETPIPSVLAAPPSPSPPDEIPTLPNTSPTSTIDLSPPLRNQTRKRKRMSSDLESITSLTSEVKRRRKAEHVVKAFAEIVEHLNTAISNKNDTEASIRTATDLIQSNMEDYTTFLHRSTSNLKLNLEDDEDIKMITYRSLGEQLQSLHELSTTLTGHWRKKVIEVGARKISDILEEKRTDHPEDFSSPIDEQINEELVALISAEGRPSHIMSILNKVNDAEYSIKFLSFVKAIKVQASDFMRPERIEDLIKEYIIEDLSVRMKTEARKLGLLADVLRAAETNEPIPAIEAALTVCGSQMMKVVARSQRYFFEVSDILQFPPAEGSIENQDDFGDGL